MASSKAKKASNGAQETMTASKDASRDPSSSVTNKADEGAEDTKIIKNPKNINYYHGLKVEGLDHVEESEPELESVKEPEPKPTRANSTESGAISKSKKRRERRARNAVTSNSVSDEDEDIGARPNAATPEEMIGESDRADDVEDTASADQKDSSPTAPGAFIDSDDDDDNISELDLDNEKQDPDTTPEDPTSPSTTTPPANEDAILTHAIKKNNSTLPDTRRSPAPERTTSLSSVATLASSWRATRIGTVGVCVPLEWFAELAGLVVPKAEEEVEGEGEGRNGEGKVGEGGEVHGEMTNEKLEGVLSEVGAWLKEHENDVIGYGWIAVMTTGFVMGYIDSRSPPALTALAVSIAVVSFFSGKAVLERK